MEGENREPANRRRWHFGFVSFTVRHAQSMYARDRTPHFRDPATRCFHLSKAANSSGINATAPQVAAKAPRMQHCFGGPNKFTKL
jgi:hypothetical protein